GASGPGYCGGAERREIALSSGAVQSRGAAGVVARVVRSTAGRACQCSKARSEPATSQCDAGAAESGVVASAEPIGVALHPSDRAAERFIREQVADAVGRSLGDGVLRPGAQEVERVRRLIDDEVVAYERRAG